MDDIIVYIILFIVYLVAQALGGKKKKQRRSKADDTPTGPLTLEEALREIRTAMGDPTAPPRPEPVRTEPPKPTPPPKPPLSPRQPLQPRSIPSRPIFESAPRLKRRPSAFESASPERLIHRAPERPSPPVTVKRSSLSHPEAPLPPTVLGMLRNPHAARTAFILSEILGPRGGKR